MGLFRQNIRDFTLILLLLTGLMHALVYQDGEYGTYKSSADTGNEVLTHISSFDNNYEGETRSLVLVDNVLVTSRNNSLLFLDVTEPSNPSIVAQVHPEKKGRFDVMTSTEDTLFARFTDGFTDDLLVFDLTEISQPKQIGSYEFNSPIEDLVATNDLLYIMADHPTLAVYDITNPENILELDNYATNYLFDAITVLERSIFMISGQDGFRQLKFEDSSNSIISIYNNSQMNGYDLIIEKNTLFVLGDEIISLNLTNPQSLSIIDSIDVSTPIRTAWSNGSHLLGAPIQPDINHNLMMFNIKNSTKIVNISTVELEFGIYSGIFIEGWIATASGQAGTVLLELKNNSYQIQKMYHNFGYSSQLQLYPPSKSLAVMDEFGGIELFNISDVYDPFFMSTYDLGGENTRIFIEDTEMFVLNSSSTIAVLNLNGFPTDISYIKLNITSAISDVIIEDSYLYALTNREFHIYDISDRSLPELIFVEEDVEATNMVKENDLIYASNNVNGVYIFDVSDLDFKVRSQTEAFTLGRITDFWIEDDIGYFTFPERLYVVNLTAPFDRQGEFGKTIHSLDITENTLSSIWLNNDLITIGDLKGNIHFIEIPDNFEIVYRSNSSIGMSVLDLLYYEDNLITANGNNGFNIYQFKKDKLPEPSFNTNNERLYYLPGILLLELLMIVRIKKNKIE